MINIIFILSLMYIVFFLKLASASNVGLIENSTWQGNLTPVRFSATAFGDINNDGKDDLILTGCLTDGGLGCEKGTIGKIYINNGTTLTESSQWQDNLTAIGWSALAFGDIDNNGYLDLVLNGCTNVSDQGGTCNGDIISKIYINNETSLIENMGWQNNLTAVFDSSMALGDIDNDGDLDLVLNGKSPSLITKIYINNGTSLVENSTWQNELTAIEEGQVALGDVDNDGDLDLALSGDTGEPSDFSSFYINNGTSFVESARWNANLVNMDRSSLAFVNFNNDEYLDLMICGHTTGDHCYLYKNNGSTFLLNQSDDGSGCLPGIYRASFAFGDYDNDGDLDLAAIGNEAGRSRVCQNNESNNYDFLNDALVHSDISDNLKNGALTWNDVDNDGNLDLLIATSDSGLGTPVSKVFINNNTISNTQSLPPTNNFSSNYSSSNTILNLSWGNGSDNETPVLGLYYNLRVGNSTNNHSIVSGVYGGSSGGGGGAGGGANGYFGNMMQRRSISLNVNLSNGTYYWAVQTIDTGLAKSNWSAVQNFTVGTVSDTTAPIILSISSSVTSSSATITWTTDESSNSTVYYGTTNATTSSSSLASLTTSHSIPLSSLSSSTLYYYNISSCDASGNCNVSSQYSFTTSAAGDGGTTSTGGGGGGSTPSKNITTQPKKFDIDFSRTMNGSFEAKQGDIKIFSFNGEVLHEIVISEIIKDSVRLIIKSEPIVLLIKSGETKQIDINKDNINDFEIKLVSILNGKANFSLKKLAGADIVGQEELEQAIRKEALFDVKVYILDKFKEVFSGEEVSAKIEVFNINNIGQVDVIVNYYLSDNESVFGSGGSDTLAVEAVASFVRSLIIPEDLKPGIYYFNVNVSYNNFTTSGNAEFKVKNKKLMFIEKKWKEIVVIAIGVAALIAIAIFIYLRTIKKREEKIEKEEQKTKEKENKLEKKEARLERIIKKLRRSKKW